MVVIIILSHIVILVVEIDLIDDIVLIFNDISVVNIDADIVDSCGEAKKSS